MCEEVCFWLPSGTSANPTAPMLTDAARRGRKRDVARSQNVAIATAVTTAWSRQTPIASVENKLPKRAQLETANIKS